MQKIKMLGLFVLVGGLFVGCGVPLEGSGVMMTKRRALDNPFAIDVCCGFEVRLKQGSEASVKVSGDDNIVEKISVRERNGRVSVEVDGHYNFRPTKPVCIEFTVENISEIDASGGALVDAETLIVEDLEVNLSGGSEFHASGVKGSKLSIDASGGSIAVVCDGQVEEQDLNASGGSVYEGGGLLSKRARVSISGGGSAEMQVRDNLDANLSGGSQVTYSGDAKLHSNVSGGSGLRTGKVSKGHGCPR